MKKFNVTGMSCAACSARVEKAVGKLSNVSSCTVNLLTNSMGVEGTATDEEIINAVVEAGYGAQAVLENNSAKKNENYGAKINAEDNESKKLIKRLLFSIVFLFALMYFGMGRMMLKLPVPPVFSNTVSITLLELILSSVILVINQRFFINGFKSLVRRSPNMDSLVALGSGISFIWSIIVLFKIVNAQIEGNIQLAESLAGKIYFESAAMILVLITVGKMLESRSKGKTTDALKGLMDLSPKKAVLIKDGKELTVPVEEVNTGDIFIVRPGESIPSDAEVIEGESAVNESALTGESVPVDKAPGLKVSAGTINVSGFLKCRALKVGKDTVLSQIIQMVSDASATKAPIAKIADKVSGVFVPVVILIAASVTAVWLLAGAEISFALSRGISVLVISCPCALGLATPVAIMVGNGVGAKNGILFKTSESLEETGKAKIVILDKTGTVTEGVPVVTDIIPAGGVSENDLLSVSLSLELKSEHPLAKAIVGYCSERHVPDVLEIEKFKSLPGNGIEAVLKNGSELFAGNQNYVSSKIILSEKDKSDILRFSTEGKTPLVFGKTESDGKSGLLGIIAVADTIKKDSREAVEKLRKLGLEVFMVTGDNRQTALAVAGQAGIENIVSDVLPQEKETVVRDLQKKGRVIMVGDGINDAPSLTAADIGIAIGSGTDIAIDAADVVLVNSKLSDVVSSIILSRKTLKNIKENLFWAFFYNILGIPLAAGAFTGLFGWELNPMFGAAAMSISSLCVISNALRLSFIKFDKPAELKKSAEKIRKDSMKKIVRIEGMMCSHCEAHVKKALEALDGVTQALPSHEKSLAEISLSKEVEASAITKAVEDAGYKVTGIE